MLSVYSRGCAWIQLANSHACHLNLKNWRKAVIYWKLYLVICRHSSPTSFPELFLWRWHLQRKSTGNEVDCSLHCKVVSLTKLAGTSKFLSYVARFSVNSKSHSPAGTVFSHHSDCMYFYTTHAFHVFKHFLNNMHSFGHRVRFSSFVTRRVQWRAYKGAH